MDTPQRSAALQKTMRFAEYGGGAGEVRPLWASRGAAKTTRFVQYGGGAGGVRPLWAPRGAAKRHAFRAIRRWGRRGPAIMGTPRRCKNHAFRRWGGRGQTLMGTPRRCKNFAFRAADPYGHPAALQKNTRFVQYGGGAGGVRPLWGNPRRCKKQRVLRSTAVGRAGSDPDGHPAALQKPRVSCSAAVGRAVSDHYRHPAALQKTTRFAQYGGGAGGVRPLWASRGAAQNHAFRAVRRWGPLIGHPAALQKLRVLCGRQQFWLLPPSRWPGRRQF